MQTLEWLGGASKSSAFSSLLANGKKDHGNTRGGPTGISDRLGWWLDWQEGFTLVWIFWIWSLDLDGGNTRCERCARGNQRMHTMYADWHAASGEKATMPLLDDTLVDNALLPMRYRTTARWTTIHWPTLYTLSNQQQFMTVMHHPTEPGPILEFRCRRCWEAPQDLHHPPWFSLLRRTVFVDSVSTFFISNHCRASWWVARSGVRPPQG